MLRHTMGFSHKVNYNTMKPPPTPLYSFIRAYTATLYFSRLLNNRAWRSLIRRPPIPSPPPRAFPAAPRISRFFDDFFLFLSISFRFFTTAFFRLYTIRRTTGSAAGYHRQVISAYRFLTAVVRHYHTRHYHTAAREMMTFMRGLFIGGDAATYAGAGAGRRTAHRRQGMMAFYLLPLMSIICMTYRRAICIFIIVRYHFLAISAYFISYKKHDRGVENCHAAIIK